MLSRLSASCAHSQPGVLHLIWSHAQLHVLTHHLTMPGRTGTCGVPTWVRILTHTSSRDKR